MANTLYEAGRNAFAAGTANFATGKGASGGIQAMLVTPTVFTSAGLRSVTGITTATPPVVTTGQTHTFTTGDIVCINGVTTGNYNGIWQIGAASGTTFTLLDPTTGASAVGAGTFAGAAAYVVNLGPSAAGATSASFTNTYVQATGVYLTGNTEAGGIESASTTTFTAVSGSQIGGILLLACAASSGAPATTDIPIAWIDGQMIVTCAAALTAGVTLPVERLPAPIATATVLSFSDGTSATLNGAAVQGARTITVTSTTVAAGARASAPATGSGLPLTPNGGNISVTWDSVGFTGSVPHVGIFKL
jgi:hypothetical protein